MLSNTSDMQQQPNKRRKSTRGVYWCFTLNNHTLEEWEAIKALTTVPNPQLRYICMSQELGESGTPHIQGYLQLRKKMRFHAIKEYLSTRIHLERAKGSDADNLGYITKDAGKPHYIFFEWGKLRKQGTRTDLIRCRAYLSNGASVDELFRDRPSLFGTLVRYHKGLDRARQAFILPRGTSFTTRGIWLYGTSGAGKSYDARALARHMGFTNGEVYSKTDSSKWWPKYNGHNCVIWNDIRPCKEAPSSNLLNLLDTGDAQVQDKGGYVSFRAEFILFTCPWSPGVFWSMAYPGEDPEQLLRRLTTIVEYSGKYIDGTARRVVIKS